jgi:hypothetical protein
MKIDLKEIRAYARSLAKRLAGKKDTKELLYK